METNKSSLKQYSIVAGAMILFIAAVAIAVRMGWDPAMGDRVLGR